MSYSIKCNFHQGRTDLAAYLPIPTRNVIYDPDVNYVLAVIVGSLKTAVYLYIIHTNKQGKFLTFFSVYS
jgi:hypothetical protein